MITNTFWTFCTSQFLFDVYLRREAKAGFDKQGWILFLRFISTGGTLGDKNRVSQKPEPAARPEESECPGNQLGATTQRLLRHGIKNSHRSLWGRTVPYTCLRMRGYEARGRKAEVTRDPEVIQWAVNKEPSRAAGITTLWKPQAGWLFRRTLLKSLRNPTHACAHGYLGPPCHIWGHLPQKHRPAVPQTRPCDLASTNHTIQSHMWRSSILGTG